VTQTPREDILKEVEHGGGFGGGVSDDGNVCVTVGD